MVELSGLSDSVLRSLDPLDLALHWAARGAPVLPTHPDTKAPWIGKQWERKATTEVAVIKSWTQWAQGARVGIKTGLACGCGCLDGPDVLDFDISDGKPGLEQRQVLVLADILDATQALRLVTPSGGEHWWFTGTDQHNKQNVDEVWGVDLRAHHGMVLAPGNPGYAIKSVPWDGLGKVDWSAVAACPGLVKKPEEKRQVQPPPKRTPVPTPVTTGKLVAPLRFDNAPGEESPMDWYTRTHDIGKLLFDDGWKYAYTNAGRDYYVRPGKETKDGISGNVWTNPDGRQTFINFSTSVDLPTDRGMSAAQWYAYRYHRGDFAAAAKQIRTTLMPRREPIVSSGYLGGQGTNQTGAPGACTPPAAPSAPEGTRTGELVPTAEAGTPEPVQQFWQRRRELQEVWYKARLGGVSPWAVLGNILANVAGRVGPHVALPPLGGVGAAASLNILVAIAGNSGFGKGRSSQVAREFVGTPYPPQRKPGTGQGIAAMFTEQTKEGPVQSNDTVVLNVSEIMQLGAHMNQQGATITSTLLEVYMAEELGEHYANKELRRPVREGAYRLALVAGVQPDNSGILFDHAASGLPQRFIWLPAVWVDAILPEGLLRPPAPGAEIPRFRAWPAILPGSLDDTLDAAQWSPSGKALEAPGGKKAKEPEALPVPVKEPLLATYAPSVRRAIETDHSRRLNAIRKRILAGEDEPNDPDSHLLLTRIKVGELLAIWLDGTTHISEDVWDLAGWVIWVSNDTRLKAQARIRAKAAEKTRARAVASVTQKGIADEAEEHRRNATYIKAVERTQHLLGAAGDWIASSNLRRKMKSQERSRYAQAGIEIADVLNDLVLAGKAESREIEKYGQQVTEYKGV